MMTRRRMHTRPRELSRTDRTGFQGSRNRHSGVVNWRSSCETRVEQSLNDGVGYTYAIDNRVSADAR